MKPSVNPNIGWLDNASVHPGALTVCRSFSCKRRQSNQQTIIVPGISARRADNLFQFVKTVSAKVYVKSRSEKSE